MVSTTTTTTTNKTVATNEKKHHSMKDLLSYIEVTAPVFHFEMSELKTELRNTTQTTAGRTTSGGRRRRGNSINKNTWCQQQLLRQQTTQLPQTKEASLDEILTVRHRSHGSRVPFRNVRIEGWIGVEHYTNNSRWNNKWREEMAMKLINKKTWCQQQQLQQQIKLLPQTKRSITRWKTYCKT